MKNLFSRKPSGPRLLRDCPHCGSTIPQSALACPDCGSDENTGWKSEEEIQYQSLDLKSLEGGEGLSREGLSREGLSRGWRLLILAVVVMFALSYALLFSL